jgi:hypothetical protein
MGEKIRDLAEEILQGSEFAALPESEKGTLIDRLVQSVDLTVPENIQRLLQYHVAAIYEELAVPSRGHGRSLGDRLQAVADDPDFQQLIESGTLSSVADGISRARDEIIEARALLLGLLDAHEPGHDAQVTSADM